MGDGAISRRLTPRRWRILSLLALHSSATTMDVAVLAGVPRLTAHRDLAWLHDAGLVSRWRSDEDRTHTWWYRSTAQGTELLSHNLAASGRPVPLHLGQRSWGAAHHLLFLPLVEVARQNPGRCELFQWLTTMDTSVWLRQYDLAYLRADGYGIWLEDGLTLRFLVHVDPGSVVEMVAQHDKQTDRPAGVLAGYRRTNPVVPVGAVLVIAHDADREEQLVADLVRRPLRAPLVTTTRDLLYQYWPNEHVWRVPGEDGTRRRLINLAPLNGVTRRGLG